MYSCKISENDSGCELEIWYSRPTQSRSGDPQWERNTHYRGRDIVKNKNTLLPQYEKRRCYKDSIVNESMRNMQPPRSQASGIVEDQQVRSLGWQRGEDIRGGQREKSLLELSGSQRGEGDRGNSLQDRG